MIHPPEQWSRPIMIIPCDLRDRAQLEAVCARVRHYTKNSILNYEFVLVRVEDFDRATGDDAQAFVRGHGRKLTVQGVESIGVRA